MGEGYSTTHLVGTYAVGDTLRVAVESGVVKYKQNGTVVYTSTISPTYPLLVDSALYQGGISNAVINNGSGGGGGSSVTIHWLVTDQLGTPRMILDQSGSLANMSRHDYLPFGEELFGGPPSQPGVNGRTTTQGYAVDNVRQQFTQKQRDNETGLDYFLARYYSASQGRFTSPDEFTGGPVELFVTAGSVNPTFYADLTDPQSLNKYQYTYNNPLRYVDPDGHDADEPDQEPKPPVAVPVPVPPGFPPIVVPAQPPSPAQIQRMGEDINKLFDSAAQAIRAEAVKQALPIVVTVTAAASALLPQTVSVQAVPPVASPSGPIVQPMAPPPPMMSRGKDTRKVINGLLATAAAHVGKIGSSDPNDPNQGHWKEEVKAALDRAQRLAGRLKGKAQEAAKQQIKNLRDQIK